jgi:hypothetical protein
MLSNVLSLAEVSHYGHLNNLTIIGALDEPVQNSAEHEQRHVHDAICYAQPEYLRRTVSELSSVE